jgi:molybdopterin-guanine dinucleotide biosynthesis protein A
VEVRIVGDRAKFAAFAPVVEDIFPVRGPLGGIHAALRSSKTDLNLIFAVDIPFLSTEFLQFMITKSRCGAMVTVPRTRDGWQPLCAVYRREFANLAESMLRAHVYRIDGLFYRATTLVIEENELREQGFSSDMFCNLNTPEDLIKATE